MSDKIVLCGCDEHISITAKEYVDIVLPADNGNTSKQVTMSKIVNNKWNKPDMTQKRFVSTTEFYIAYPIQHAKTKEWMMKIMNKDDFTKKTAIKKVEGTIKDFMFKNNNSEDDKFIMLTYWEGVLQLSVYDILVTENEGIDHLIKFSISLSCPSLLPLDCSPILAVQPPDQEEDDDDVLVVVGVYTTVYIIKNEAEVRQVILEGVTSPIVSIHVANDEDSLIATCSRDGTITFYNASHTEQEENKDPWNPFHDREINDINVVWAKFLDSPGADFDSQWHSMLIATNSSIYIVSMEFWDIFYQINLILPSDHITYNMATRGDFLIISCQCFIYLIKIKFDKDTDNESVTGFSDIFCYPISNELYDLSIVDVKKDDYAILDRFSNKDSSNISSATTLSLIVINNSAMYKMTLLADTNQNSPNLDLDVYTNKPKVDMPVLPNPSTEVVEPDPYILHMSVNMFVEGNEYLVDLEHQIRKLFQSKDILSESDLSSDLIEFYNSTIRSNTIHPTSFNQLFSKHLLLHMLFSPATIKDITINFKTTNLDDDFCFMFIEYLGLLLAKPMWNFALQNSQSLANLINELYLADVMKSHNMLRIFEKFVKSFFDIEEDSPDLADDWLSFICNSIKLLIVSINKKDKDNQGFVLKIKNIVEPLKYKDPSILHTEPCNQESDNEILKLLITQRDKQHISMDSESVVKYKGLIGLMTFIDSSSTDSLSEDFLSECSKIVGQILVDGAYEEHLFTDIANELVNNYCWKDWFDELVMHLINESRFISPLCHVIMTKVKSWFKNDLTATDREKLMKLFLFWEKFVDKGQDAGEILEQYLHTLKICFESIQSCNEMSGELLTKIRKFHPHYNLSNTILDSDASHSKSYPARDIPTSEEEWRFSANDIREPIEHMFQRNDKSYGDISHTLDGLENSLRTLKSLNTANVNNVLKNKLSNILSQENSDDQLKNCSEIFFNQAYGYLQKLFNNFLKEEMIANYSKLHDDVVSNINNIQFPINQQEICNQTADIVKTICNEVRKSINSVNSEDTLKVCVNDIIIPNFKVMLDEVYQQFHKTLEDEFIQNMDNLQLIINEVGNDEKELLKHLNNIESKINNFKFQQGQISNSVLKFSQDIEVAFKNSI